MPGSSRGIPLLLLDLYSPECVEKLSDSSGRASFRSSGSGPEQTGSAVSAHFVPPDAAALGRQSDLSDSFKRKFAVHHFHTSGCIGWPLCYIFSTQRARHSGASKGSPKYPLALFTLPSSKSITSQA
jgi:hypothetical protein